MQSRFLYFAVVLLAFACNTPSAPTADEPRAAFQETSAPVSGPNCNDDTFCTREYLPTSCQFRGQHFEGSNPCETKRLAKRFACENSVPFVDAAVQCQPKDKLKTAAAGGGAAKNCTPQVFCTREMNPHNCVFGGEKFHGNN